MKALQSRSSFLLLTSVAAIVFAVCSAVEGQPQSKAMLQKVSPSTEPQYDAMGHLKRPTDFQTWVFVGANIGLQYRKDLPETTQREQGRHQGAKIGDFHNIYVRPESYASYLKTGKFPEMTVLVMDVYESKEKDKENVVVNGLFPGDQRRIEVAVKNSKRPDGAKTNWAYYEFDPPTQPTAKAFPDSACYDCHRKHASVDNVWVQFYPILRSHEK